MRKILPKIKWVAPVIIVAVVGIFSTKLAVILLPILMEWLISTRDANIRMDLDPDTIVKLSTNTGKFKDRIYIERKELETRIAKLKRFFDTSQFAKLSTSSRNLLKEQCDAMEEYLGVIKLRMEKKVEDK